MEEEEVKYTIPYETADGVAGSEVDVTFTYNSASPNPDGSFTVTGATGTYETLDASGNVVDTDTITGLAAPGAFAGSETDNELFITSNPTTTPIVTQGGITYTIDNAADSNDGAGDVNFFDNNGALASSSAPTDTPSYMEYGNNENSATSVTEAAVCFASGSRIRVMRGPEMADIAVETLEVGDIVVTASGARRPIRWLGRRDIDCRNHPAAQEVYPVRIAAHTFAPNRPSRDLYLSPGHPVLVGADDDGSGGYLVPIMCLINGTTVERVPVETVTYWHVELDEHDILLAEGLPAESYIDLGSRPWFDGADGALYDPDMALPGQPGRCRSVAIEGPIVDAERRRLDAVFATSLSAHCGWPATDVRAIGL